MKSVYQASDTIDGQRVVDLLAFEGIAAHVQGGYLAGAIGELPAGGLISVWVADDDVEHALEAIAEDARLASVAPHAFGDDDGDETAAPAPAPSRPRSLFVPVMVSLVIGTGLGWLLAMGQLRPPTETDGLDFDQDGSVDQFEDYEGERFLRIRSDRNGDGAIDHITEDPWGTASVARFDDDFDGRFETTMQYSNGQVAWLESDLDGDGEVEWRHDYHHGVILTSLLRNPETDAVVKRVTYAGGQRILEEFDADGDGALETVRNYDPRDERIP